MTFEHKLFIGLEEIKAIVFECRDCKSRTMVVPELLQSPPKQCPQGHNWDWNVPAGYETTSGSAFVFFFLGLKKLRDPMIEKAGFRIFLELDEPTL